MFLSPSALVRVCSLPALLSGTNSALELLHARKLGLDRLKRLSGVAILRQRNNLADASQNFQRVALRGAQTQPVADRV